LLTFASRQGSHQNKPPTRETRPETPGTTHAVTRHAHRHEHRHTVRKLPWWHQAFRDAAYVKYLYVRDACSRSRRLCSSTLSALACGVRPLPTYLAPCARLLVSLSCQRFTSPTIASVPDERASYSDTRRATPLAQRIAVNTCRRIYKLFPVTRRARRQRTASHILPRQEHALDNGRAIHC
jgi:hypothetical protein